MEVHMKVLVLGGTRFVGVHLVKALLSEGHSVTIATRGNVNDNFGNNVERIIVERTNSDSILKALHNKNFDVVCDNLAYSSIDVKCLLDNSSCDRYVMTSSASVYKNQHHNTEENEFNPVSYPLEWCSRHECAYDEAKRQAECALFQTYSNFPSVAVRYPYIIGEDDYTERLFFYVEQIIKGTPINIDNLNKQISFIRSTEAGAFLAWIVEQEFTGPINGNNIGTISLQEIISYVERKTGRKAELSVSGLHGTYNGQKSFSLSTVRANNFGYNFTELNSWIYELLDSYIKRIIS